jgi:hypothetical protein
MLCPVRVLLVLQVAQACRSTFTSVVREVLLALGGYESKEVDGQVMAAFHGPRQALEWALALQCALLQVRNRHSCQRERGAESCYMGTTHISDGMSRPRSAQHRHLLFVAAAH